jgi:hypothetical protein|tara:strand:+ start:3307 stop:3579 length:273 start_codon:yes stop_codon:yes gene_type:complete
MDRLYRILYKGDREISPLIICGHLEKIGFKADPIACGVIRLYNFTAARETMLVLSMDDNEYYSIEPIGFTQKDSSTMRWGHDWEDVKTHG